jgi:hypothetical protein
MELFIVLTIVCIVGVSLALLLLFCETQTRKTDYKETQMKLAKLAAELGYVYGTEAVLTHHYRYKWIKKTKKKGR